MTAKKFNQGKVDLSLLPATACYEEAKAWMFGMDKYGRDNWKKLWGDKTIQVAMGSLLRHAFAILDNEMYDKESGLHHAAHIRCNAAMILEHAKSINNKKFTGLCPPSYTEEERFSYNQTSKALVGEK